jgi:tRNA 2-thiouridine synthesizing protein B
MLHTINKAPHTHDCFDACLRVCGTNAAIILIEDGVYAAIVNSEAAKRLCAKTKTIFALQADIDARGLSDRIEAGIQIIDYAGFVQLCCEYKTIQSWY